MEVPQFSFPMDMRAGYHILKNEFYEKSGRFYDRYHDIMCNEIEKNNILCVNGLNRWD